MEFYKVEKELGNLVSDNVKKLESIFPSVVKDGEVDFEELRYLLGNFEEVDKEKYEMNWVGKKDAKKRALSPLYGKTLKYVEGSGKNEDTTENIYIEGDNLEVLKLLQNSYYGSVKMIYIDPPYNTGNDFIYDDNFKKDKISIEILEGDRNEYGESLIKNQKSSSHYHSKWLSMMYSRLLVCKNILKDDGVLFISIDDNEITNLKKMCDEIFGENNFIGDMPRKTKSSTNDPENNFNNQHDYLLIYGKSEASILKGIEKDLSEYKNPDKDINGPWKSSDPSAKSGGDGTYFEIINPYTKKIDLPPKGRFWAFNKESFEKYIESGKIKFKKQHKENERGFIFKTYRNQLNSIYKPLDSLIFNDSIYMNQIATKELNNMKVSFDYAKPTELLFDLIKYCMEDNGIIVDFFSGSATTAHAVMKLNAEDNGNRKFIMVQLAEKTHEKSEAYKNGYKNICEIGKDRIRRAGDKIVEENKDNPQINTLDIGFKVFRVENSNIKWENRINEDNQFKYNLDGENVDDIDFMPNTKDIDVVYEILLRHYGIPLTAKINKLDFIGDRTYTIENSIIVCLETKITQDIIDKISELEPIKVIFRDSAFGDDISLKQNSIHRLNVLIEENNKNTTHVVEFI